MLNLTLVTNKEDVMSPAHKIIKEKPLKLDLTTMKQSSSTESEKSGKKNYKGFLQEINEKMEKYKHMISKKKQRIILL